jgi:type IV fimbrial biogenesis protein FimT
MRTRIANAPLAGHPDQGFTLIEVLVVVAISAILLAIAVPSFTASIGRAQMRDAAFSLQASFELARSEAARLAQPVTVCRIINPATPACSVADTGDFTGGDWAAGWVVFVDPGLAGAVTAANTLRVQQPLSGGGARAALVPQGGVGAVSFAADRTLVGPAPTFDVRFPQPALGAAQFARTLTLTRMGQVNTNVN